MRAIVNSNSIVFRWLSRDIRQLQYVPGFVAEAYPTARLLLALPEEVWQSGTRSVPTAGPDPGSRLRTPVNRPAVRSMSSARPTTITFQSRWARRPRGALCPNWVLSWRRWVESGQWRAVSANYNESSFARSKYRRVWSVTARTRHGQTRLKG